MGLQSWQKKLLFVVSGLFVLLLLGESFWSFAQRFNQPFPGFFLHENMTVGPYYAPGWSGPAAGLQSLDKILAVDGVEPRSRAEFYELARRSPAGAPLRYRVERDGGVIELTIPSMNFTLRDGLLSFAVYSAIGLTFLAIGVAPYVFGAASPAARPLCFMVLMVFVWFQSTLDFMTAGVLPKELRIFALSLTPSAAIHLALLLRPGNVRSPFHRAAIALIYGVGAALAVINSANFFGPVEIWRLIYSAGYIYICLGALAFLVITGAALRRSDADLERSRLRVMFVGAVLGFLMPALIVLLATAFNWPIPYNLALVPTVVFPISVAYALLKYSLFDLGNALRLGLSRIALVAILLALYGSVAFLIAPWAGDYGRDPLISIFFSLLVVALFNPLLRWLENVVDRYIYRQEYDPVKVQAEISLMLRTLAQAPALARRFIDAVSQPLGIKDVLVIYGSKHGTQWLTSASPSLAAAAGAIADASERVPEIWAGSDFHAISRDEVAISPLFDAKRELLTRLFEPCRSELLMPLVYEHEARGVVSFGAKRSGQEYSSADLRLLGTLTDQLALSLENGRLYEASLQASRQAEEANKKLLETDRIKKDFVANICHELRTPITAIIGFGEVLRDLNLPSAAQSILDKLVNNGQELSSLMDNLMNYSRMEAGKVSAQSEIVELKKVLAGLEMMTQRMIRARPIEFGVHNETDIDRIQSDGQKLQQILMLLLTNALKFTEKGRIDLSIRGRTVGSDDMLEIAVADTGIGIKREDQELIFEDFRQLDGSSTRQFGGTGLGLGLCKKLAAALGGEIGVSSELGVGSVFSLRLPLRPPEPAMAGYARDFAPQLLQ